jgi:hypothetical protein
MNMTFQFIGASLIIALMIGFTLYAVNTEAQLQIGLVTNQQIQPEASRLLDKLLLSGGYPTVWGHALTKPSALTDIGLGTTSSQNQPYQLDVDKVLRFTNASTNPTYIPPNDTGSLLGIYQPTKKYYTYGFNLHIQSGLNVTIKPVQGLIYYNCSKPSQSFYVTPQNFSVTVNSYTGQPAKNANVSAALFVFYSLNYTRLIAGKAFTSTYTDYQVSRSFNITDKIGTTLFGMSIPQPPLGLPILSQIYVFAVTANYFGLKSSAIFQEPTSISAKTLSLQSRGNYLLGQYNTGQIKGLRVTNSSVSGAKNGTAIEFTSDLTVIFNPLNDSTNAPVGKYILHGSTKMSVLGLKLPAPTNAIAVALVVTTRTHQFYLSYAPRFISTLQKELKSIWPYSQYNQAINYGSNAFKSVSSGAVTINALVVMGQLTYYITLTVWKESGGE